MVRDPVDDDVEIDRERAKHFTLNPCAKKAGAPHGCPFRSGVRRQHSARKPAGGIGDKAAWVTSTTAASLYVLKGSNAILIDVRPEAMKGDVLLKFQPALTRLGKLAASRM